MTMPTPNHSSEPCSAVALAMLYIGLQVLTITPSHADKLYPCAFADTINITGSYHYDTYNYSYVYEDDFSIPQHLVAEYDFIMRQNERLAVPKHLRACVCQMKPCLRLCCPLNHIYDSSSSTCLHLNSSDTTTTHSLDGYIEVQQAINDSATSLLETARHFSLQVGVPCEKMRFVTKDNKVLKWNLFPNGTIFRKNYVFSRNYCLTPYKAEDAQWEWQPLACPGEKLRFVLGVMEWTYAICLIITVICLILILIVYTLCSKLRSTFYGAAIQSYVFCVIVGYSLLVHLVLTDPAHLSRDACMAIPCHAMFFLLLSFYILTLISLNFYMRFHGIVLSRWNFCLIVIPVILLVLGWSFYVSFKRFGNRPVLGSETCWFDPRNWSIMSYFYAPVLVSFAISGFFYIITLVLLYEQQDSQATILHTTIERNRFKSFRLYCGYNLATWLAFIVVFVLNYYRRQKTHTGYGASFFVALQGFGALYSLVGKNQQVQKWLRNMENDVNEEPDDDEDWITSVRMKSF